MIREKTGLTTVWAAFMHEILLIFVLGISGSSVLAQSAPATPASSASKWSDHANQETRDPIERSDEFKSKLTFGIYFTSGERVYDLNLRRQFGPLTAWIAGFYDPKSTKLMRVGAQYDYKKAWFHFVPTMEV